MDSFCPHLLVVSLLHARLVQELGCATLCTKVNLSLREFTPYVIWPSLLQLWHGLQHEDHSVWECLSIKSKAVVNLGFALVKMHSYRLLRGAAGVTWAMALLCHWTKIQVGAQHNVKLPASAGREALAGLGLLAPLQSWQGWINVSLIESGSSVLCLLQHLSCTHCQKQSQPFPATNTSPACAGTDSLGNWSKLSQLSKYRPNT